MTTLCKTFLAAGFLVSLASFASAQIPTQPCPQPIIDWLQDPNLGGLASPAGEGANDCEVYLHGLGDGLDPNITTLAYIRVPPSPADDACGPEFFVTGLGQLRLVEPADAVCHTDTAANNTCPV